MGNNHHHHEGSAQPESLQNKAERLERAAEGHDEKTVAKILNDTPVQEQYALVKAAQKMQAHDDGHGGVLPEVQIIEDKNHHLKKVIFQDHDGGETHTFSNEGKSKKWHETSSTADNPNQGKPADVSGLGNALSMGIPGNPVAKLLEQIVKRSSDQQ